MSLIYKKIIQHEIRFVIKQIKQAFRCQDKNKIMIGGFQAISLAEETT